MSGLFNEGISEFPTFEDLTLLELLYYSMYVTYNWLVLFTYEISKTREIYQSWTKFRFGR